MRNRLKVNKLNFKSGLMVSLGLHALVGVYFAYQQVEERSPLPLGVELFYQESASLEGVRKASPQPAAPKVQERLETDDIVTTAKEQVKPSPKPVDPVKATLPQAAAANNQGNSTGGALTGQEGVANGSEVSPEERFKYEVLKLVERKKSYPVMAKKLGHKGTVYVRFVMAADGSIVETQIVERAPHDILNKAAQDLVKSLHGLKPFPNEIKKASLTFEVPVQYILN